jgi:CBS domain-containing protein
MRVDELMTKDVSSCHQATNAAAAAEIMWKRNCGILPITGESGRIAGVVTDRDLFIALGTQNRPASELAVGEIMHRDPTVGAPDDDVRNALKKMAKLRVHRLPVVDESGALKGILSMNDVVVRTDSVLKDDVIRTLRAICEHEPEIKESQAIQRKTAVA